MTDAAVSFTVAPAGDVIVLDLWSDTPPAIEDTTRMLRVEPRRWWLIDAGGRIDAIAERIGDSGVLTPIGGGLMRATLTGPGWRALLSISGWFDSEDPRFVSGMVAATTIHHVPVWIAPTGEAACEVYWASSYLTTLVDLWSHNAIGREGPS